MYDSFEKQRQKPKQREEDRQPLAVGRHMQAHTAENWRQHRVSRNQISDGCWSKQSASKQIRGFSTGGPTPALIQEDSLFQANAVPRVCFKRTK